MINRFYNGFFQRLLLIFESQKPDINEDVSNMVLYINKNYTPSERLSLIKGIQLGVDNAIERERDFFKEKYAEFHEASIQSKQNIKT